MIKVITGGPLGIECMSQIGVSRFEKVHIRVKQKLEKGPKTGRESGNSAFQRLENYNFHSNGRRTKE